MSEKKELVEMLVGLESETAVKVAEMYIQYKYVALAADVAVILGLFVLTGLAIRWMIREA